MLLWLATAEVAEAAEVVVFGDSWAEQSGAILGERLRAAGYSYDAVNYGVGGTTAAAWNDLSPNALTDAVTANPDARWVWLSILGNDVFALHLGGQGGWAAGTNRTELTELVDRLHAAHPDVKVVSFAYDYVNFELSQDCKNQAYLVFSAYHTLEMALLGVVNTAAINGAFERDVADVQSLVSADRAWYDTYRFFGTLQGVAGTPGAPNPLLPSPASLMRDCIHPTDAGYRHLHDALIAAYWDEPAPTAVIAGAEGPACRGLPHVVQSASTGASDLTWWVDDVPAGTDSTLELTPADAVELRLRADHAAWRDETTATLSVVDPPVIDAGPDRWICAGESLVLSAVGGPVSWTPADALEGPEGPTPTARPTETTTYVAHASSAPGCDATDTVTVTVLPVPDVVLAGPEEGALGEALTFVAAVADGLAVVWQVDGEVQPGADATLDVVFETPGAHEVRVAVTDGSCASEAAVSVTVAADATDTSATDDPATEPSAPSCACAHGAAPGAGLIAVLPWWAARRRRREGRGGAAHWT